VTVAVTYSNGIPAGDSVRSGWSGSMLGEAALRAVSTTRSALAGSRLTRRALCGRWARLPAQESTHNYASEAVHGGANSKARLDHSPPVERQISARLPAVLLVRSRSRARRPGGADL